MVRRGAKEVTDRQAKRLPRLSLFFFNRPLVTFLFWAFLFGFGILSYTTLLERQGFPPVQAPLSIVSGSYVVNDPAKVDNDIAKPISEIALKQRDIKSINTTATANTFQAIIQYKDGTEPKAASSRVENAVQEAHVLPELAKIRFQTLNVSKYSTAQGDSYDLIVAFYGEGDTGVLKDKAQAYAEALSNKNLSLVKNIKAISPFLEGQGTNGTNQSIQTSFDRYGERNSGKTVFHNDVVIGIVTKDNADTVKAYHQIKDALSQLNNDPQFKGKYQAAVTAAFGPQIEDEVNELQRTLLEGLVAVLILGSILIALRASILILISMATVLAATIAALYILGYTLNVITLFSLILGLSLIVDDTIIMTEALDVERRRRRNAQEVVKFATRKVSLAMVAATSTAALGFAPIIFVSGILGGFIRPIPITIITSLIISLIVALTIIPFFGRFLILRKKHIGTNAQNPLPVRLQESFAHKLTAPLRWTHHSSKRLWLLGVAALIVGMGFIFGGAYIFKYLTFNIFPNDKDSNQLMVDMSFPAGTDLNRAQQIADDADNIVAKALGENLKQTNYYGMADSSHAQLFIDLIPYTERSVTSPQLIEKIKDGFKGFNEATVQVSQQDVGGPPGGFNVLIETPDRAKAQVLADDMVKFLQDKTLTRADGSQAHIVKALVLNPDAWQRKNNKQFIQVSTRFDASDTSTLVDLAKKSVQKAYTDQRLAKFSLNKSALDYDFGFEDENQKSFNSMLVAFPILLLVMYILLAFEFKSLLQPLLIFMAIPFSFFGVTGGLWLTDNPFSFFTMLGFFALIGLSIKNTILLTDYANQSRRAGMGRVDAIASALEERFRPLLATSVTAIFSLLPLALTSPFWEALAFTLIFGLLSSTTLVILIFPYYYLGGEYLRLHISRKMFFSWVLVNAVVIGLALKLSGNKVLPAFLLLNLLIIIGKIAKRRSKNR